MEDREWLWYQLTTIPDVGIVTLRKLLECTGSLQEAVAMRPEELEKLNICSKKGLAGYYRAFADRKRLRQEYELLNKKGIRFISIEHKDYPEKLRFIPDAPYGLWVKGKLPSPCAPSAAIIGARGCTSNGLMMAASLGSALAKMGIQVISGMAVGIDSSGQWGALRSGGYSLGVLAGGVDICYPRTNLELYEALSGRGGIISESSPGTPPVAALFRLRNRLISGISDCVIVVEAREKSGTQITVNCALNQGKEVFAIPGRMTDSLSRGCNQMISQGARILWDFSELSDFFGIKSDGFKQKRELPAMTRLEEIVFEKLTDEPKHIEDILNETGLPVGELMELLFHLEIKGLVHQQIKNYYHRCTNI